MKTEEEMRQLFSWCPEACDTTLEIADKCNYELDWTHMYLPEFPGLEPGETAEERFREECEKGLARRYGRTGATSRSTASTSRTATSTRPDHHRKGFANYFLIVQDYVQWAKDNGIGVGPGRGSAAGAIVAYAMNITNFDPLENGLMFERFLSPQRSEMPDIDMDFDDEHLQDVLQHVRDVYGEDRVCKVITYSHHQGQAGHQRREPRAGLPRLHGPEALQDAERATSAQAADVLEKIARSPTSTPRTSRRPTTRTRTSRRIIDAALSIEGLMRGEGVHACARSSPPRP
jgi:DNA polymerase-3 subunit alpha